MHRLGRFLAGVLIAILSAAPLSAADIFVSPSGTGIGSMADPMSLQAALTKAANNYFDDMIYLQQGTYSAAAATFMYDITGDSADPDMDVTLSGGWNAAYTSRSDDPSLTVLTGGGFRRVFYINARAPSRTADVFLENLTLRDGYATDNNGGGILGQTETGTAGSYGLLNLSLTNCVLTGNRAEDGSPDTFTLRGGAIFLEGGLTATDCEFSNNQAEYTGAVDVIIPGWSAASNHSWSRPASFTRCEFRDNFNTSLDNGPAVMRIVGNTLTMDGCLVHRTVGTSSGKTETILALESAVKLTGCEFRNNIVDMYASAIDLLGSSAEITNCLFENNRAGFGGLEGGGVITGWNYEGNGWPVNPSETVTVTNCTFVGNKGYVSGGYSSVLDLQPPQEAYFSNCILKGNDVPAVRAFGGTYALRYSDLDGTPAANNFADYGGNLSVDPSFQAGDTDYKLNGESPLIDAGDNSFVPSYLTADFKGAPRIFAVKNRQVAVVDMGWDEYYDGVLQLTSPSAGTFWLNDSTPKSIAWTCSNIPGNVRLSLWQGPRYGGHEVMEIASSVACADSGYSWTPPAVLPEADDYAVAIDSLFYTAVGHGTPLSIRHMHLTAPNGGQRWRQGAKYAIRWASSGLTAGQVRIELLRGGTSIKLLTETAPNTGSWNWKVPYTVAPGNTYRIRVSSLSPDNFSDEGDADFTILPAVWVTSPNGGQVWKRGTAHPITWRYAGSPGTRVRIDLFRGGVLKRTLTTATSIGSTGMGSWLWTIPATLPVGTDYTIRIRSTTNINCFDFSNAFFRVSR